MTKEAIEKQNWTLLLVIELVIIMFVGLWQKLDSHNYCPDYSLAVHPADGQKLDVFNITKNK